MIGEIIAERPDRSHLTDSRPIRWDCEAVTSRAQAAVDALLEDLEAWEPPRPRKRRADDRERLRAVLGAITLEVWRARQESPTLWLAYPRGDAAYLRADRYRHPRATTVTVNTVVEFLTAMGLAEERRGSYRRTDHGVGQAGIGYRSRLRGTGTLTAWAARHGLTADDISLSHSFETIRLKGSAATWRGNKPLLSYEDTTDTTAMRGRLRAWTEMMERHQIALGPTEGGDGSAPVQVEEEEEPRAFGRGSCRLYRVFNDGRWDRGGRFYGGWWQGLSGITRRGLRIDGEATVELDFASLHPRLCYQLNGSPLAADDDPYTVPGVPDDLRDVVKVAMMQLLNAKPGRSRLRVPEGAEQLLNGRMPYNALVGRVEAHHAAIADWFRQGPRGLELQAIDAAIADSLMTHFTVEIGRPILPVHDSFIVARRDEAKLAETMTLAYLGQLSGMVDQPSPPVIRGWNE